MIKEKKIELKELNFREMEQFFESFGEKKFRASQVFNWMYNNLATDFEEMRNLPKSLIHKLKDEARRIVTVKNIGYRIKMDA